MTFNRLVYLGAMAIFIGIAILLSSHTSRQVQAQGPQSSELREMNHNLERIATSLEIISGQRSGWKIPATK
jgi:hypothetical protein